MRVEAIDGSIELCRIASEYTGIGVRNLLFQDLDECERYDAIWACSSILHLSKNELKDVFRKMLCALKPGGISYTSFKYGEFEGERNGRFFVDFTETSFFKFVENIPGIILEKEWVTENINYGDDDCYRTDVMTGDRDKRMQRYYQLASSIRGAESVDIMVSFLMESGMKMIVKDLEKALRRGTKIRILTDNYLRITQPLVFYMIKRELGEQIDLRLYNEKNRSFHSKSCIFHYKNYSEIYVGSSDISKSVLTSGIEWNYRFRSDSNQESYEKFLGTFENMFYNHSIVIHEEELKRNVIG